MAAIKEVFKKVTASGGVTNTICDFIIRPPRSTRTTADLGPTLFRMGSDSTGSSLFIRQDFELENMRGMMMKCSWFKPQSSSSRLPCVVYCHANCGSRYDSLEVLFLLNHGFTVFSLDFSGSGQSEGEFISLGYYERQDLAVVVDYLQSKPKEVDTISLWGRSMGAVTSIMYAAKDPSIKCVVADSPFSSLHRLIHELVNTYGGNSAKFIPNVVIDGIIGRMKNRIAERASFDLDDLDTTKYARECVVPTFIIHGAQDDFVVPNHSLIISNNFKGMCLRTLVEGGHNDGRSDETEATALSFLRVYAVEKPKAERDRAAAEMAKRVSSLPQAPVSPPLHPAPASQGPPRVASSMPSDVAISGSEHLTAGDLYLDPTNLSSISALPISFRTPTLQPAEP